MADQEALPTSAVVMSIAKHIAIRCHDQNVAFMQCKKADRNPETCLKEGNAVSGCVIDILKDLNARCPEQLKNFHECMDYYSNKYEKCRKEQKALEEACCP